MLRATWNSALAGFHSPRSDVDLRDAIVLLVGSANVYTALLPWMVLLTETGTTVRVKPARGQMAAVTAMAKAVANAGGRCEVWAWKGGDDLATEREALVGADAVIAFGGLDALDALQARSAAPVIGFGPRFGVGVLSVDPDDDAIAGAVVDTALYDSRGCMSPAAVFVDEPQLDRFTFAMAEAEARWPLGAISAAEAGAIRARVLLTRALGGEARQGKGWTVLCSRDRFEPIALPRVLALHPMALLSAVLPYADHLGTVAGNAPELPALRRCALGEMQSPHHDGTHEGIDVMGRIAAIGAAGRGFQ